MKAAIDLYAQNMHVTSQSYAGRCTKFLGLKVSPKRVKKPSLKLQTVNQARIFGLAKVSYCGDACTTF